MFKTHTNILIDENSLIYKNALKIVAENHRDIARNIFNSDCYAAHVTEEQKITNYNKDLLHANQIENGTANMSFTLWQEINTIITGECVPLFHK
jgi:hypothetical protein